MDETLNTLMKVWLPGQVHRTVQPLIGELPARTVPRDWKPPGQELTVVIVTEQVPGTGAGGVLAVVAAWLALSAAWPVVRTRSAVSAIAPPIDVYLGITRSLSRSIVVSAVTTLSTMRHGDAEHAR
ncbi:hypothetical protein GCM10009677_44240 [Sphaerisporangium rubeum]